MGKIVAGIALFLGIIVLISLLGLLMAYPVMWAVNWLFTSAVLLAVFGTAKIGFWQAYVLLVLCGILFKSSSTSSSK